MMPICIHNVYNVVVSVFLSRQHLDSIILSALTINVEEDFAKKEAASTIRNMLQPAELHLAEIYLRLLLYNLADDCCVIMQSAVRAAGILSRIVTHERKCHFELLEVYYQKGKQL